MKKSIFIFAIFFVSFSILFQKDSCAQAFKSKKTKIDTVKYGKTPAEYKPYGRFSEPYKQFFMDTLEYTGYGRNISEPSDIDSVKIGFVGPIISSTANSNTGIKEAPLRVGERVLRWDGYQVSYLAPIGIKMLQGSQLAIEQANARGGYRGRIPYELIIRNDNGSWRSSGRATFMMAYKDKVWAILGTVDGANSHITIRAALKAEVPVMNTADTDPTFVETLIPWVFRSITDDRQMCYLLADFAFKKLSLKKVAAIRVSNRYGRISIDEFRDAATRLGHPFQAELQYEEGDTNFYEQLKRIQSLNVDGVITYGNAKESALILKQMREMGMIQWFLGSNRLVAEEFITMVGKNHGKVAAGYPYDPTSQDPKYLQFKKDFQQRFNEEAETYAAHAFDGMNMVIQAIEKAGLNRALIRDELAKMVNYEGVTGKKELDAVFSNRTPATLAILENGKFVFYSSAKLASFVAK